MPVFADHSDAGVRVALTPLAVAADAVLVGAVLFVIGLSAGGAPGG